MKKQCKEVKGQFVTLKKNINSVENFQKPLAKLQKDFTTVTEVFKKRLNSLKGTPSDEANFKLRLSKHSSIILISDNVIKKYELVIKETQGQITMIEDHKKTINSAFDEAKKEFDDNITKFIKKMTDYRESLQVGMKQEIK